MKKDKIKTIKPTLTKGAAKVPVIMQLEDLECGAASLAMLMACYEKWVPLEQVRVDCGVSRDGSSAKTIVSTLAPLLLNTVMMFFYLFVMIRYSLVLTLAGIGSVLINLAISHMLFRKRINLMREQMRDRANSASTAAAGIEQIETLKASGAENGFFRTWAGYQATMSSQSVKFTRTENVFGVATEFVGTVCSFVVYFLGIWFAMNGSFTMGMITAFQGFPGSFTSPATTLVAAGHTIQEMRTQVERIDDVMEYPADKNVADAPCLDDKGSSKLRGGLELKNITFGYSRLAEPLIKNFSMTVKPGQRVAFVGTSGCVKSTLVRLLPGFEKPEKGAVYYDGRDLEKLDKGLLRRRMGVVMQSSGLFKGTIFSNIAASAPEITADEAWRACEIAGTADNIRAMPMGMRTHISEGSGGISGGRRQRILIARAIVNDPKILIFDEATMRGVRGEEDVFYKKPELLREYGFRISCNMCVTRESIASLWKTIQVLSERGVSSLTVYPPASCRLWKDKADSLGASSGLVADEYERVIEEYTAANYPLYLNMYGLAYFDSRSKKYVIAPKRRIRGGNADAGAFRNDVRTRQKEYVRQPDRERFALYVHDRAAHRRKIPEYVKNSIGRNT